MTLKDWVDSGWLRNHRPSLQEMKNLLSIVDRDLHDAGTPGISADWRFGMAYSAALKLCTMVVHASGYRVESARHHYLSIAALPLIMGERAAHSAQYLEGCRRKRNVVEYDLAGVVSEIEADGLFRFACQLREDVLAWIEENRTRIGLVE